MKTPKPLYCRGTEFHYMLTVSGKRHLAGAVGTFLVTEQRSETRKCRSHPAHDGWYADGILDTLIGAIPNTVIIFLLNARHNSRH